MNYDKVTLSVVMSAITTREQLEDFYYKVVRPNITNDKMAKFVDLLEKSQLRRLYSLLYGFKVPMSYSCGRLVSSISNYFESIARAKSMKP